MTADQARELDVIRFRLDQMCGWREIEPWVLTDAQLYDHLSAREAELLAAR